MNGFAATRISAHRRSGFSTRIGFALNGTVPT
jgi:hypothetical protein